MDSTAYENAAQVWLTAHRKGWKPRTTLRKIATIRTMAKYLGSETEVLVNYHAPKPERLVAHPLDGGIADVHKLISACKSGREQALVALCGFLGLRVNEAIAVTCDDFDFSERTLTVRSGKGDKDRTIPVPKFAWRPLFAGINDQPANDRPIVDTGNRNARYILTDIGRRCGIKLASHDLRSTLLTAMYRGSKDLRAVQTYAGHASSATTEAYTQIRVQEMREALGTI